MRLAQVRYSSSKYLPGDGPNNNLSHPSAEEMVLATASSLLSLAEESQFVISDPWHLQTC